MEKNDGENNGEIEQARSRSDDCLSSLYNCVLEDTLVAMIFNFHREMSITKEAGIHITADDDAGTSRQCGRHASSSASVGDGSATLFGGDVPRNQRRSVECKCFVCNRMIAAVRFAPHLEKCIGIGRNARVSRRIHRGARYVNLKAFDRVATRSSTLAMMEEAYVISALEDEEEDDEEEEEEDDEEADTNWSRTSENGGSVSSDRRNRVRSVAGKRNTLERGQERSARSSAATSSSSSRPNPSL